MSTKKLDRKLYVRCAPMPACVVYAVLGVVVSGLVLVVGCVAYSRSAAGGSAC